jgi:hypothetical protein
MLRYNKAIFDTFVKDNGDAFPYSDAKRTRSSFLTKWLLLKSKCASNVLFRPSNVYVMRSSCFTNRHLQDTIVSGNGIPLPPDFCDVIDCMEYWGRMICPRWEQDVLSLMWDVLRPRGLVGVEIKRSDLFYDCIMLLLERKLGAYPFINKVAVLQEWQNFFYEVLMLTTSDYFKCATESIWFVEARINNWIQVLQTPPMMQVVVPDTVESEDSV